MQGKAIIISSPSGGGKTTIVKHLLELDLGLEFSVSACSRSPRGNETHGKDYYFLSTAEFREKIKKRAFVEWEEVYKDQYYGTLKSELERIRNLRRHVIFDVDVVGGMNLKKYFGKNALALFIQPPSMVELEKRLRKRSTDGEAGIRDRIARAGSEMKYAGRFDVILINDRLEDTLRKAKEIVKAFL